MSGPSPTDYRWLVGDEGRRWIERAAGIAGGEVRRTQQLRRELSPERTHLVLDQLDLRRRARAKFSHPDAMFFTRRGLEQATDEFIAAHKARRFEPGQAALDLCCGIGGDLVMLAERGPATGLDRDPGLAVLAEANAQAYGRMSAHVEVGDAEHAEVESVSAWHLDPDRRSSGRRTTRVELHEPNAAAIEALLARNDAAGIKLAPAATLPDGWESRAELEWISRGGECRQLVAWFGKLAYDPGRRRATVIADDSSATNTIVGEASDELPRASRIGSYLYEPDAAVLVANLRGTLAAKHGLAAFESGIAYLTAETAIDDPARMMAGFEVLEMLPFDVRRVKALLGERGIGRLEIKQRGTDVDPHQLRPKLRLAGDAEAVLIVTRRAGQTLAILARRLV